MSKKVMIIDDEEHLRNLGSALLKHKGYEVITAAEGMEAVLKAKASRPDLILLDINLPDISGYEVFKQLLADDRTRNIPVVVLTVSDLPDDITRFIELGAKGYVLKGADVVEWMEKIESFLKT